jgi:hypothetical protein
MESHLLCIQSILVFNIQNIIIHIWILNNFTRNIEYSLFWQGMYCQSLITKHIIVSFVPCTRGDWETIYS